MTAAASIPQDSTPRRVLIVHGYGASVDAHWFPWLREELSTRGVAAEVLELPHPEEPDARAWEHSIATALGPPDESTWIVAHSLGSITALRVLAAQPAPWRLGGLVLVAGFTGALESLPALDEYLAEDVDAEHIAKAINVRVVVRSDNDALVPAAASDTLAGRLDADLLVEPGAGHFLDREGVTQLPVVLTTLLGARSSRSPD